MNLMNLDRFRLSRIAALGLIVAQGLGLSTWHPLVLAQSPNAAPKPALPTPISPSSLIGLEQPPQIAPAPTKPALPANSAPSSVNDSNANIQKGQLTDLIGLYQDATFSDPVLNAARFNYQASKELYWQGLSLLLPQANATPGGTRYYQHGVGQTVVAAGPGNSRVFDQKITLSLLRSQYLIWVL